MRNKKEKLVIWISMFCAIMAIGVVSLSVTVQADKIEATDVIERELTQSGEVADLTISSARELNEFAQKVNNGNNYEGKVIKLTNDIVFDGVTVNNFTPIGTSTCFEGIFDGCGYTISGIDVTGDKYAALFANAAGEVKNITVKNCQFSGTSYAAGIAARFLYGTITNCHVIDCRITQSNASGSDAGGIVGEMCYSSSSVIKNCSTNSTVINKADAGRTANQSTGGIVGDCYGEIINCCNTGSVTGGDDIAGGICGTLWTGTIQNCFNVGSVTDSYYIGGIVGYGDTSTIVANCYTSESACATNFGSMKGTEKNCKAYTSSYMQSAEFLNQMNTNRGSNTDWFRWEKRAESAYPLPVKVTNINKCSVGIVAGACVYNGKAQTPAFSITNGSYSLVKDVDYTVTYQNNINAGTATAVISGKGMYTGDVTKSFTIQKANTTISYKTSITKTYGAKAFSLGAKLKTGAGTLSYNSTNKKVVKVSSKGKITIKGVGKANITITCPASSNYKATTVTTSITVKPKKQSVSAVVSGSKMKVTWKKDSKVSGYQIQYANNKSFKKNCKTITIKKKNKTSYAVKKLKKGKTYYVRVRSYKNVSSNGQTMMVAGAWSKVKKVSR